MSVKLFDKEGNTIDMDKLAQQSLIEERKSNSNIHKDFARDFTLSAADAAPESLAEQVAEAGLNPYAGDKVD